MSFLYRWKKLSAEQQKALNEKYTLQELVSVFKFDVSEIANTTIEKIENEASKESEELEDAESYSEFLLAEYNNIASAHFNANGDITKFFQFYLLIIGLPITLIGILARIQGADSFLRLDVILRNSQVGWAAILILVSISLVGICMLAYIVNLRIDSLLYARVVNGVRNYFVSNAKLNLETELSTRVLPRSTSTPPYENWAYFGCIVFAFAILNNIYWVIASLLFVELTDAMYWMLYELFIASFALLGIALNLEVYRFLSRKADDSQLMNYSMGFDIDGVLNDHRKKFCEVLKQEVGTDIQPENITKIPVHECKFTDGENKIEVSRDDEMLVFNTVEYWSEMHAATQVEDEIKKLQESLNYTVKIFTHRPWPNPKGYLNAINEKFGDQDDKQQEKVEKIEKFKSSWNQLAWFSANQPLSNSYWIFGRIYNAFLELQRHRAMKKITKRWLKSEGIRYKYLRIERGDVHVADTRSKLKNRFTASRLEQIRFFVEDDPIKAKKLSRICEFVYLVSQPYNKELQFEFPPNVRRVDSLEEIRIDVRDNF
ncbi:MAG: hypothetical protein GKR91_05950 [Pseudomonadales bacterium]|nr:hypothetical protein [Pseudomonadales bacterium]